MKTILIAFSTDVSTMRRDVSSQNCFPLAAPISVIMLIFGDGKPCNGGQR